MAKSTARSFVVNRDATLATIQHRKSVCLDTNVWVNLHHERTPAAKRTRSLLYDVVNSGKVFCPLSAAVLWELYKQDRTSRMERAALMEDLSLNVCLANSDEIFTCEIM